MKRILHAIPSGERRDLPPYHKDVRCAYSEIQSPIESTVIGPVHAVADLLSPISRSIRKRTPCRSCTGSRYGQRLTPPRSERRRVANKPCNRRESGTATPEVRPTFDSTPVSRQEHSNPHPDGDHSRRPTKVRHPCYASREVGSAPDFG
jgi:hypothetical protein